MWGRAGARAEALGQQRAAEIEGERSALHRRIPRAGGFCSVDDSLVPFLFY